MQLAARVVDLAPKVTHSTWVALEAVDLAMRELCEKLDGIAPVVAADLKDQRIVPANKGMDLGLREQARVVRYVRSAPPTTGKGFYPVTHDSIRTGR